MRNEDLKKHVKRQALSDRLHHYSQWYYCAGWIDDWEYRAWAVLRGDASAVGLGRFEMKPEHIQDLRTHADAAKGWFHWPPIPEGGDVEDAPLEPVFIEMSAWEAIYAQWKREQRSPSSK